jgi:cellulose synthase/poly-beta-1,6-N-acetylglucosamine synthase-like glycosyltransferase
MNGRDSLIVVADNCTDDTAGHARLAGVTVLVREDLSHIGKGYALDWAIRHLQAQELQPDVILFVDADCWLEPGTLDSLVHEAVLRNQPIQSTYLLKGVEGASSKTRLREFAFAVRNLARPLGGRKFGMPCPLMGSGMAFPWSIISQMDLASGHLVEDRKLGVDCTAAGYPPRLLTSAIVLSPFPENSAGQAIQTERWESGAFMVIREFCLPLIGVMLKSGRIGPGLLALDLMIPPLGLLVMLNAGLFVLALAAMVVIGPSVWLSPALLGLPLTILALVFAFIYYGKGIVGMQEASAVASLVLGKFRHLPALFGRNRTGWVRSARDRPESRD